MNSGLKRYLQCFVLLLKKSLGAQGGPTARSSGFFRRHRQRIRNQASFRNSSCSWWVPATSRVTTNSQEHVSRVLQLAASFDRHPGRSRSCDGRCGRHGNCARSVHSCVREEDAGSSFESANGASIHVRIAYQGNPFVFFGTDAQPESYAFAGASSVSACSLH